MENGIKQKENRLRLGMRKKFFTGMVVRHWNRLTKEAADAPFLEALKARMDEGQDEQLGLVKGEVKTPWQGAGTRWSLRSL